MRVRYLSDWRFQLRYVVYVLSVLAILSGVFLVAVTHLAGRMSHANEQLLGLGRDQVDLVHTIVEISAEEKAGADRNLQRTEQFVEENRSLLQALQWASWGFIAVVFCTACFLTILITHRIAGPMMVIRRLLRQHRAEGQVERRNLRKGDEFRDVFELLFEVLQRKP